MYICEYIENIPTYIMYRYVCIYKFILLLLIIAINKSGPGTTNGYVSTQVEALGAFRVQIQIFYIPQQQSRQALDLEGTGEIEKNRKFSQIQFFKKIIPGDKFKIFSKLVSSNRGLFKFEAEGYIKKKIACKACFTLILPSLVYIKPSK